MKSFKKLRRELLDTLEKAHWQALEDQYNAYYVYYNKNTDSFLFEDFCNAEVFDGVYWLYTFDYTWGQIEWIKNRYLAQEDFKSLAQEDFKLIKLHPIANDIMNNRMFFIYKKEME